MVILVGYASAHGSTREIAERIGGRLREHGNSVDIRSLARVADAGVYDAVVMGSAIHNGAWLREGSEFLRRNCEALAARPVWAFSVGSHAGLGRLGWWMIAHAGDPKGLAEFEPDFGPRDHHRFAGAFYRRHTSFIGNVIFRAMGGRYGDYRDWAEIDAWAEHIAAELELLQPAAMPKAGASPLPAGANPA
ncbi:MAG: flavodoxin domain-containing protein [Dehalococcoidia bacterium]|nr:flavodoxin domain-containing protein [Dehalococcoidia bacterium]